MRAHIRGHYRENRSKYVRTNLKNKKLRREKIRKLVEQAKDVPCADCGGRYPSFVMEFDHVRGRKSGNVADLARSGRI